MTVVFTHRLSANEKTVNDYFYRLIADNSPDTVVWFRGDDIVWISPSVESLFGEPQEHWIGRNISRLISPPELAALRQADARAQNGRRAPVRMRLPGPIPRWVELECKIFHDFDGEPDGMIASLRLLEPDQAVQQAAAHVTDNSCIPASLISPEGRFLLINRAMCEFLGYDAESLSGMNWLDIVDFDCRDDIRRALTDLREGRQNCYQALKTYIHADGHRIWGDISLCCARTPSGELEHFVAQIVDVTHDVEAGQSVIRSQRLIETSTVGTALCRIDGRLVAVNPAMCTRLGFDADTLLSKSWPDLIADQHQDINAHVVRDLVAGRIESHRETMQFLPPLTARSQNLTNDSGWSATTVIT